jgi:chromosome partitioning protein
MKVISFVTQKGGSGKTTLAINCAVAAVKTNKKVLILDMDAQGTAESWYQSVKT